MADGEEERVETELTIRDNDAEFDNVQDDTLQVEQSSEATVSGTTNAAPGEELSIRLRRTGENPFLETQTVEVAGDGTFNATFDTSEIPVDTEFTASAREGSETIGDEVNGVIVEQQTPTPEETPTTEPEDGQPGFGVAIAIVALLGAALLELRRRD